MEEREIKQHCIQLMETADAAYLSTISADGFPHTRMMANLRNEQQCDVAKDVFAGHEDDFLVYMITSYSSPKMQQIRANPNVSVYYANGPELQTLLLVGKVDVLDDSELKQKLWQDEWKIHWPGGADDPEFTILQLLPAFAKGWYKDKPFEYTLR